MQKWFIHVDMDAVIASPHMRGLTSRVDPIPNCINVPFPAQSECELRPVSPYGVGHFRKNSFIDLDESRVADLQPTPDDYTAESLFRGGGKHVCINGPVRTDESAEYLLNLVNVPPERNNDGGVGGGIRQVSNRSGVHRLRMHIQRQSNIDGNDGGRKTYPFHNDERGITREGSVGYIAIKKRSVARVQPEGTRLCKEGNEVPRQAK